MKTELKIPSRALIERAAVEGYSALLQDLSTYSCPICSKRVDGCPHANAEDFEAWLDANPEPKPEPVPIFKQGDGAEQAAYDNYTPDPRGRSKGGLAQTSEHRKRQPMYSGLVAYFPDALAEVAELSFLGNEKHNPGQPLHWNRSKSGDELDCLVRHLAEIPGWIEGEYERPVRHATALAWRALAYLQKAIEAERGDGKISPGSRP